MSYLAIATGRMGRCPAGIEIDGDVHAVQGQKEKDQLRQEEIESLGYQVIRYSNEDVLKNLEGE